jgi:hypothetical protein
MMAAARPQLTASTGQSPEGHGTLLIPPRPKTGDLPGWWVVVSGSEPASHFSIVWLWVQHCCLAIVTVIIILKLADQPVVTG